MNNSTEQEARILYEIVHDGIDCSDYLSLTERKKSGWRRLAELVLVDKNAKSCEAAFHPPPLLKKKSASDLRFIELMKMIPKELYYAEFMDAWAAWIQDRKDRKKALTDKAAELQLGKCLEMGLKRATAAIYNSIEKGYQGIFEPTNGNKFHRAEEDNPNRVDF